MIEINLAPGAQARRAPKSGRAALQLPSMPAIAGGAGAAAAGAGGLVLLLLVGFAFWRLGAREAELQTQIEQAVTDSTRYAATIALVNTLQARQDTIEQKIEVIRQVDQRRYVWPHLLDEISRSVPEYTWLTQITSTEEPAPTPVPTASAPGDTVAPVAPAVPAGPNFTIQGNAGSTQALTRFMKNLEASPFIRDVTLVTSEQAETDGRTIHRFTLEARYERPDSSVIETVPIIEVG